MAQDMFADFFKALNIICLIGFLVSAFMSFLFVAVIRIKGLLSFLIWTSSLIILMFLLLGGYSLTEQAKAEKMHSSNNSKSDTEVSKS